MPIQYIIALGSNTNSEHTFMIALAELNQLGDTIISSIIIGKDFTGKTDLIYHNAMMMITLYEPLNYDDFNQILKNIEIKCGRIIHKDNIKFVPMDLDILAYHQNDYNDWIIIEKRLPFKAHEKKGLDEIAPFLGSVL